MEFWMTVIRGVGEAAIAVPVDVAVALAAVVGVAVGTTGVAVAPDGVLVGSGVVDAAGIGVSVAAGATVGVLDGPGVGVSTPTNRDATEPPPLNGTPPASTSWVTCQVKLALPAPIPTNCTVATVPFPASIWESGRTYW